MVKVLYEGKLKIYGGWREIGGNCVVVEEGDRKIIFDNGIRFQVLKRIYGGRITPLGPREMQSLGVIPDAEVYEGAEALYISHGHLDHVGLLYEVPDDVKIVVPSRRVFEATIFDWYGSSNTWLNYVKPKGFAEIVEAAELKEDEHGVIAVPVSHSAYPAYAYIYHGKDITLFYSGDLRLEPLSRGLVRSLDESLQRLGVDRIDVAVLEGTNFGRDVESFPVTAGVFREFLINALSQYELVAISVDPLDLEAFRAVVDISNAYGRKVVVASPRLLWAVELLGEGAGQSVAIASEVEEAAVVAAKTVSVVEEVLANRGDYVVVIEPVALLDMLRRLRLWRGDVDLAGSLAVLTDPEPREAVKEVEERVIAKWLSMFGFQTYRLRVSGHYYPHDFAEIIRLLKPKELVPIHTNNPEYMVRIFRKIKG